VGKELVLRLKVKNGKHKTPKRGKGKMEKGKRK